MITKTTQQVFAHLSGQDDNLGDSALRIGYLNALRGAGRHVHVFLGTPTPDYAAAFSATPDVTLHAHRSSWSEAQRRAQRPVHAFNAGEINPRPGVYPVGPRAAECARVLDAGGAVIFAGIGIKDVHALDEVEFDPVMRAASVMSWRDQGSRDAAGFGEFAPDWAFSLGTPTESWPSTDERPLIAITMRFDRAWPGDDWIDQVRSFAAQTGRRIVTLAQVSRDAPRAVRLAEELGGEYLFPPSMRHDDLDVFVRDVYRRSLAVISDRAHGLIIAATEGAYPLGSGSNPQKISRLLNTVGLGALVGGYDQFPEFAQRFQAHVPSLGPAIDIAREEITVLVDRMHEAMTAVL